MARGRAESSGAAEAGEQRLVGGEDARDRRRLGLGRPLVELERAAEHDAVGPREHVAGLAGEGVADLRLRQQDGELAAGRPKLGIAEPGAGPAAGAVEYQRLRKGGDLGGRGEGAALEPAAGSEYVAHHLPQIAAGLDVHRVVA